MVENEEERIHPCEVDCGPDGRVFLPQRARRAQSFLGENAPSAGGENNVGLQLAIIFGLKTIVKKRMTPFPVPTAGVGQDFLLKRGGQQREFIQNI